jgi:hypothetical protein
MKKKNVFALLAVLGLTVLSTACSESMNNAGEDLAVAEKSAQLNTSGCIGCNFNAVLTAAEIKGLMYMREEEKVARDVYLTFAKLYPNARVFSNIAKSEQAHMNAILNLLNGYKLTDPVAGKAVGEFTPAFQGIYDGLILSGKTSLKEALLVGVDIEEMDIDDLKVHIGETMVPNILQVYKNLLAGSGNHLKAFNFNLSALK